MATVDELKKQAIADLVYDEEQRVKNIIKDNLRNIISEQKKMADSAKRIAEYQANLKAVELNEIKIEL